MYNSTILSFFSCNGGGGTGGGEGTGAEDDAPRLTSIDPAINAVSIYLGSGITATFDQSMKAASKASFPVYGLQTGKLAGLYLDENSKTLRFVANNRYQIGEEVEVILTRGLRSTDDVRLKSPYVFRYIAEVLNGNGNFASIQRITDQVNRRGVTAGDWNGDANLDLAVANFSGNNVDILENDGNGGFITYTNNGEYSRNGQKRYFDTDDERGIGMPVSSRFKFHVIGAGRGGTSLLAGLLDAHPRCQVLFEEYSRKFLLGRETTEAERFSEPSARIKARVQNFLRACEKKATELPEYILGHKTTTEQIKGLEAYGSQSHQADHVNISYNVKDFDTVAYFADQISDKKVIFILRDGRTCTRSKVNRTGQSFEEAIRRWKYSVFVLQKLSTICSQFCCIKFEDLVYHPEKNLRELCDFLDIEYDEAMLGGVNNPKMRSEYRRETFDKGPVEVSQIDEKYVREMREELVSLGYIEPSFVEKLFLRFTRPIFRK